MKRLVFVLPLIFLGCSVSNTTSQVKDFAKCYINKMPAPFWVCYQTSFVSVGKVHAEKLSRLKQEEAYSVGVSELIAKLQAKTRLFLRKLGIKDHEKLLKSIKDYVVLNAIQGDSWFNKNENMIYVEVSVDKKDFEKFILSSFKNMKKEDLKSKFDETF